MKEKDRKQVYATVKLENVELEGIDRRDYPDFVDAFITYAEVDGVPLSENAIEWINENLPGLVQEMAMKEVLGAY